MGQEEADPPKSSSRRRTWVRRRAPWRRTEGIAVLSNANTIDAPTLAGHAAVAPHSPAQYEGRACRETHRRGDKSARVPGRPLPASQRIAAASTDRSIVTTTF
jgi:hypothetical protein